jgi:hypothetical protein
MTLIVLIGLVFGVFVVFGEDSSLIERLDNRRVQLSDPMSAAIFTMVVNTAKEYGNSGGCSMFAPGCEHFRLNIINHFCNVNLQHMEQFYEDKMEGAVPADVIYGGSKNVGGAFYDMTSTYGVQRYRININGYIYYIDTYWCIDCMISKYGKGTLYKDVFGLSIQPTNGHTVYKSYDCFKAKLQNKYGYPQRTLPSGCNSYFAVFGIYPAGGNSRYELRYDNGDVGIKLRGLMSDDESHILELDIYPLKGQKVTTASGKCG